MQRQVAFCTLAVSLFCGCTGSLPEEGAGEELVSTGSECPADSTLSYENFAAPFFERYCLGCHSSSLVGSERHGAPSDHNFDTLDDVFSANLAHIDSVAAAGPNGINTAMPRRNPRPSDEERFQLGEWLACGAP